MRTSDRLTELRRLAGARTDLRSIPGFDGYYCSKDGIVYSIRTRWGTLHRLKPELTKYGYHRVDVTLDCKKRTSRHVHRLVALSWLSPADTSLHVCHINGNKLDNRAENLKWATQAENNADKIRLGETAKGSGIAQSKLKGTQVVEIRGLYSSGRSAADIARKFAVSNRTIANIIHKRTWRHI